VLSPALIRKVMIMMIMVTLSLRQWKIEAAADKIVKCGELVNTHFPITET